MSAIAPLPPPVPLRALLPLVLAAPFPAALGAQRPEPVAAGATVCVVAPPSRVWRQGQLVSVDAATLVVGRADGPRYTIPVALVQ